MNPDDHGHDRDLRGQEPPGAGPGDPGHDYGVQGGPAQLGIIFPAQAQVTQHNTAPSSHMLTARCRETLKSKNRKALLLMINVFTFRFRKLDLQ